METLRGNPDSLPGPLPRIPSGSAARLRPFRYGSLIVRLAGSLPDLEACLALERQSPAPALGGRLAEPTAVPDCDFLVAADLGRRILGTCRLLPRRPEDVRHSLPGAPRTEPGDPRFAAPAALLTALRYASRGVLEAGGMAVAGDADAAQVVEALWEGLAEYMSTLGYGYALGRERVVPPEDFALEELLGVLLDDHGLHPDLEAGSASASAPRPDWLRSRSAPHGQARDPAARCQDRQWLPQGFQEGLKRGIHLLGSPMRSAFAPGLEFAWVASSEILRRGGGSASAGGPFRGAGPAA